MSKYTKRVITINMPWSTDKILDSNLGDEMANILFPEIDNIITRSELLRRMSKKTCEKFEKLENYSVEEIHEVTGKIMTINEEHKTIDKIKELIDRGFFISRSDFYRVAFYVVLFDIIEEVDRRKAAVQKQTVTTEFVSSEDVKQQYKDWVKIDTKNEKNSEMVEIVKINTPDGVKVYKIAK